jgi:hypothetical protein
MLPSMSKKCHSLRGTQIKIDLISIGYIVDAFGTRCAESLENGLSPGPAPHRSE